MSSSHTVTKSLACRHHLSLTANQPHLPPSALCTGAIFCPHPSTPAMSHVFLGPLSSSQLPMLHPSIIYLPAMTVCLQCKPDHVLIVHAILPWQTPHSSWVLFCSGAGSRVSWSVWWMPTMTSQAGHGSSGHVKPSVHPQQAALFHPSMPSDMVSLCLECPSPTFFAKQFLLVFQVIWGFWGSPLNGLPNRGGPWSGPDHSSITALTSHWL